MNHLQTLVPRRVLPVQISDMALYRAIKAGTFPPSFTTINGRRYWRDGDLTAWYNGKRSGWSPDTDTCKAERQRRTAAARRTRGLDVAPDRDISDTRAVSRSDIMVTDNSTRAPHVAGEA